ncbi:MAG: PD-(D/E)XK nuclease family protein [Chloroflexi bacterium]|nr:PD-(D/E)XK nuclease family protein [Chloroflexota bacterium]
MTSNLENIRPKLEALILGNNDFDLLESELERFNIFSILKIVDAEIRHSAALAWLLDPQGAHGLQDRVLSDFVKQVVALPDEKIKSNQNPPSPIEIDAWSMTGALVETERAHIDILISDQKNKFVCAIENKVGAEEHSGQLGRYADWVEDNYPDHSKLFIFLSVGRDEASDSRWISVGYDLIYSVVDRLVTLHRSAIADEPRMFLDQYLRTVRDHFMTDSSKVVALARRLYSSHREAIEFIVEHRPNFRDEIYASLMGLVESSERLSPEPSTRGEVRFTPTVLLDVIPEDERAAEYHRLVKFWFANEGSALSVVVEVQPWSDQVERDSIIQFAKDHKPPFTVGSNPGPRFARIYVKRLWNHQGTVPEESDIDDTVRSKIESFLTGELVKVIDVLSRTGAFAE